MFAPEKMCKAFQQSDQQALSAVQVLPLPTKLNDPAFRDAYAEHHIQLAIVAGFSRIIPLALIDAPAFGTINLHAGRIPQYRGGSPLNWQIINDERAIGVSILRMTAGLDDGPVLAAATFPLADTDNIGTVHARAHREFSRLAVEVVAAIEAGKSIGTPQVEGEATYWHQRNDADGKINWQAMTARQTYNLVRAVTRPYPGAHCSSPNGPVRIFAASLTVPPIRGTPGRVVFLNGRGPYVVCKDGALLLTDYETSDSRPLTNGIHLK